MSVGPLEGLIAGQVIDNAIRFLAGRSISNVVSVEVADCGIADRRIDGEGLKAVAKILDDYAISCSNHRFTFSMFVFARCTATMCRSEHLNRHGSRSLPLRRPSSGRLQAPAAQQPPRDKALHK
jgi:hypothetical protein